MLRIHWGFLRLVSTVTMVVSMGALTNLQAPAQASSVAPSDPAIGPNTLFDLAHQHDSLHFTPATTSPIPRRSTQSPAAGLAPSPNSTVANGGALRREVLGFAPYWELSQQNNWNYSLLSTVAYFGLDLKGDGSFDGTTPGESGWNSAQLTTIINAAHQAGDRVVVVVKAANQTGCDGACNINQLVTDPTGNSQKAAISNIKAAIAAKSLDGVNVDLEGTSVGYPNVQAGFTAFIRDLSSAVHAQWPSAYVTVDTYSGSASWDGGIFKIGDLAPLVDGLFDMAYDMYSANMQPGQAGPNAPLSGPWQYTDTLSVSQYLTKAPASKILLGVPYYGYKWSTGTDQTTGTQPYAMGTSGAEADTYSGILSDFSCALNLSKNWDAQASSPWATWWSPATNDPCGGNHNSWRELYYDNAQSLGLKYDLVNLNNLQGTGMWALGFDGSSPDLWPVLAAKFGGAPSTFYFAEGFTGGGFSETLDLLMPGSSGVVYIDYYTENGHLPTFGIQVSAGKVAAVNVNQYVGAGHNVSAVVHFPAPGVAERVMHFNNGAWHGSTANVGVAAPASEWDFAEGSTFGAFSEYLTLQNPSGSSAPVTLNYMTDATTGPTTATKTLSLPPNSRTTIPVFRGDMTSPSTPCAISGGTAANCGVGPGVLGVSTQVLSPSVPIVVERPMYVDGFNFGDGIIRDGHDAFGVNAVSKTWNFAEGTTLQGFREYLTLQNPQTTDATVNLKYVDTNGNVTTPAAFTVKHQSRTTVPVFDASQHGIGPGVSGVSVQVTSDQAIVAERPMYMVFNFGNGSVAGAHDVTGSTTTANTFEFANASTAAGENDFLTIQNLNSTVANLTISYYGPGGRGVRYATVAANSRHTIALWVPGEGAGPNVSPLGIVVVSDQPVLIEEPTYNAYPSTYGATDTVGYTPPTS
jgi:spore germination protein YaaH